MIEFNKVMNDMFNEAQAKLPVEDRAATSRDTMCLEEHCGYKCTKTKGHSGYHMAHGRLGDVFAKWK